MMTLDRMLERAEVGLKKERFAKVYKQLRAAYPQALQQLAAASDEHQLASARRALLRCQDGLARCHEARGELGPAAYAARAAIELACALDEPEDAIASRATYFRMLRGRLAAA
jgi:hypothetical protein